jgi:hypothetical protein
MQEKVPEPTPRDTKAALLAAIRKANCLGLTRSIARTAIFLC